MAFGAFEETSRSSKPLLHTRRGVDAEFMDVGRGWEPAESGGFGFGGAGAPVSASRRVPYLDGLLRDPIPSLPGGEGYGGAPWSGDKGVPFHNVRPRTRAERQRQVDKEGLEKGRLAARKGAYHVYSDPGKLVAPDDASAAAFVAESDRFVTDVVGEERLRREELAARRAAAVIRRREEAAQREEERWQRMEEEKKAEEERLAKLRARGTAAKKNSGSEPYDLVTQVYKDSEDGLRLRFGDEMVRWRAAARAQVLQAKSRGADFDPITGKAVPSMQLPPAPVPPPVSDGEEDDGDYSDGEEEERREEGEEGRRGDRGEDDDGRREWDEEGM